MSVLRSRSISLVTQRRHAPLGFTVPMAPSNLGRPPSGPRWLHEIKQDGYRICARKDDAQVRVWTRLQNEVGGKFERIVDGMRGLKCRTCTIDGEAVVQRSDGHCDFYALKSFECARAAVLVAFDLLELNGDDLRKEPLEVRRAKLQHLCSEAILFSDGLDLEGWTVFEQACRLGVEGIVSKRKGSIYVSGKSDAWVKTLNPAYDRK